MRALVILAIVAGCHSEGPGEPLAASQELIVVAHQDDDVLFMQPDVIDAIQRGGVTTVYVTAGNGKQGAAVAERRYAGARAAYGSVARDNDWACGTLVIAGHAAQHCRLERERISLVFLGYPDGGKQGEVATSLLHLWKGDVAQVAAIGEHATYTRDGLIATVGEIVRQTHPKLVRTLDATGAHGYDHADHVVVGALAMTAIGDAFVDVLAYRGYNVEGEPENVAGAAHDRVFPMVSHYEACAARCASCGSACSAIDPQHETWMKRRYAVGFRNLAPRVLRAGSRCLRDGFVLGECAGAPTWELDGASGADGKALVPGHRVWFDDEGHLWLPSPGGGCLSVADRPAFGPCDAAAVWTSDVPVALLSSVVYGDKPTPAVTGDLDGDGRVDSCSLTAAGPRCKLAGETTDAPWGFAVKGVVAFAPLRATLTDIDHDGRADLCAVVAAHVSCARSQGHAFGPGFEAGWAELSDAGGRP